MSGQPSPAVQDYLKLIHHLEQTTDGPISTQEVADGLRIAAPPATRMLQKMAQSGWLDYSRYQGVRLTDEGRRQALLVLRTHRILEVYLSRSLGYSWDEVHDEADLLEHAISPRLLERLDAALGHPTHDPHGSPIPTRDGHLPASDPVLALADVPVGESGSVARVNDEDPDLLRHLADVGLVPGVTVRRTAASAPWGTIPLQVEDREVAVHAGVAPHIFVTLNAAPEGKESSTDPPSPDFNDPEASS
ncbi:MAG: metal-dependent transcriptional regulator [Armatimonadetes bacterium]|nr:metal-dependent transcriptional regulator [Armatimonadota bacterium]